MTQALKQIVDQAMTLGDKERAELMSVLADSFGPAEELEYAAEWGAEIKARIAAHESGEDPGTPWEEARKNMFGAGENSD
jgi:putative addiction module component (TIGR02574 family)